VPIALGPAGGDGGGPSAGRIHGCNGDELFVCRAIRRTTCDISSALKREKNTRCSVWQLTQPPSAFFCGGVPDALMINSAFVSCRASLEALVTFVRGKSSCVGCAATSIYVRGSSYPTARMLNAYLPGSILLRGKLY
jgi:hypothetical protein